MAITHLIKAEIGTFLLLCNWAAVVIFRWWVSGLQCDVHVCWKRISDFDSPDHRTVFHFVSVCFKQALAQIRHHCFFIMFTCGFFMWQDRALTCHRGRSGELCSHTCFFFLQIGEPLPQRCSFNNQSSYFPAFC